jgi:hypothetical protein
MPSQPSLHASPCRKWLLADLDVLHAQIYSHESERLLWQSRFPAVNADRGKLLSYGYPAVKILARLYLPGSLLCKSQSVSPNRDVRARIMRFLYCPQVPMRVRSFCNETDNLVGRRVWIAWLSLYASHVRGPVSSHFHRWGVNAGDRVTYQRQGQSWNVVSGYTADNRIFYRKTMLVCGGQQWHNLEFEYPASHKPAMDEFVTRASYTLEVSKLRCPCRPQRAAD